MIQIVEDDIITCHTITSLLKRMRLAHREARTGEDALEQLTARPVDLVITDMRLPDMSGLELMERKARLLYIADIPIICITEEADIAMVEVAIDRGAVDFVRKPVVAQTLAPRILRALDRAPARWESWREMNKRLPFYSRTLQPMLGIAQQVLRDLDDALAKSQYNDVSVTELNTLIARVRGVASNVGALRTVQQIDKLWHGAVDTAAIVNLRAALVIELAGFDEAIQGRVLDHELHAMAG